MAAPVWVLSVDLVTKSATFTTGMAEAARTARGTFTDIKAGASEMGGHVSSNLFAARHSVMALSEEFGGTMPRALTAFIAHLGPMGPALTAAFPFLAISLGAFLFFEHLQKVREEAQKLAQDQSRFGTASENAFNTLDSKILQAEKRSDELKNDHLGALHKELELINRQSMEELVHSFGTVEKAAETVFGDIQSHWYTMGVGASGAKASLDSFTVAYEALLAKGDDKGASALLADKLAREGRILAMQKQAENNKATATGPNNTSANELAFEQAMNELKQVGVGHTENEVKAQETLVSALQAQVGIEQRVAALKGVQAGNAGAETGKQMAALRAEGARQAAEHAAKMGELAIAGEREQADAAMTIRNASIAERLGSDIAFADREYAIQLKGNAQLAAALDKGANDYTNKLKAMQEKAAELTAEHANAIGALMSKANIEQHAKELADMEGAEREKIDATEQGSAQRLTAILNALKNEEALGLQSTAHYRELFAQRVQAEREATDAAAKIAAEAGKQDAEHGEAMGLLRLAALREQQAMEASLVHVSIEMRKQQELQAEQDLFQIKHAALAREIMDLNQGAANYQNQLKALLNKDIQIRQQHENQVTQITSRAETEREQNILSAQRRVEQEVSKSLSDLITGHRTFAQMVQQYAQDAAGSLMRLAVASLDANERTKMSDAGKAARDAFKTTMAAFPSPVNLVMAPLAGASAFTTMMGFNQGGIVPGMGSGDITPIMATPGESILPKKMTEMLLAVAQSGGLNQSPGITVHVRPTYHVQALDGSGMSAVLEKHTTLLEKHFRNTLRKMSR